MTDVRTMKGGRAIGIDLGTSNSVAAVIDRDGMARILTTPEGSTMLPSVVWFTADGPLVGERAREGLDYQPDMTVFGAKRLLGRRFDHPEIKKLARVLPYDLTEAPNGDTWIQLTPGRVISPEEVCALILRELRQMAVAYFGEPVTRAEAREVGDAWAPYRSVATWYIWRSLDPLPVEY